MSSTRPVALTLMWSISSIILRFIMPRTAYSPRSVSPRTLHWASALYEGTSSPAGSFASAAAAVALPMGLSCCGPVHFSVFQ